MGGSADSFLSVSELVLHEWLDAWLCRNIEDQEGISGLVARDWSSLFLVAIWTIWKARNEFCFNSVAFSSAGVVKQAYLFAWDMQLTEEHFHGFHLDPMNGRWFCPPLGYLMLMAACVRGKPGLMGYCEVFVGSCRFASAHYAELVAMKEGLLAIHQKKCMRVIIESDSSEVVQLINGFPEQDHPFLQLILECKKLHLQLWACSIMYVSRNYNNSADCIAKLGHTEELFGFLIHPPLCWRK